MVISISLNSCPGFRMSSAVFSDISLIVCSFIVHMHSKCIVHVSTLKLTNHETYLDFRSKLRCHNNDAHALYKVRNRRIIHCTMNVWDILRMSKRLIHHRSKVYQSQWVTCQSHYLLFRNGMFRVLTML